MKMINRTFPGTSWNLGCIQGVHYGMKMQQKSIISNCNWRSMSTFSHLGITYIASVLCNLKKKKNQSFKMAIYPTVRFDNGRDEPTLCKIMLQILQLLFINNV